MTIKQYKYQVVNVNSDTNTMMISYSAEGFENILVGAMVPVTGESLLSVVERFAPWAIWEKRSTSFEPPAVGAKGDVVVVKDESNMTIAELKTAKKQELSTERAKRITYGVLVDGVEVPADDSNLAMLRTAIDVLSQGVRQTVDWRDVGGGWISMDKPMAVKFLNAANNHIEDCFSKNRQLSDAVDAAATKAEVVAIKWGE